MADRFNRRSRRGSGGFGSFVFNILTLVVLLLIVAVGFVYASVFLNPYVSYNPFPPPTLPAILGTPTPTVTPAQALPTSWTPTASPSPEPTQTATPSPSPSPTMTPTETPLVPPFALQPGNPVTIPNIANDDGCDWIGVGGQVFSLDNEPIVDLGVHLEGELDGQPVSLDAITGSAPAIGPSGYVFNLGTTPVLSEETLWIQLNDGSESVLSAVVFLSTSDDCNENFVMVNWRQVRE